jgi:hypothetical protein
MSTSPQTQPAIATQQQQSISSIATMAMIIVLLLLGFSGSKFDCGGRGGGFAITVSFMASLLYFDYT